MEKQVSCALWDAPHPVVSVAKRIVNVLFLVALGFLAVGALFVSTDLTNGEDGIIFRRENPLWAVLFVAAIVGISYAASRLPRFDLPYCAILCGWVVMIGVWWVLSGAVKPVWDSATVLDLAGGAAQSVYAGFLVHPAPDSFAYVAWYPYQLGFVLYAEGIIRLFHPKDYMVFELLNVLWLAGGYAVLFTLCKKLVPAGRLTAALMLFAPPIFFTAVTYGNTITFFFAVLALRSVVAFFDRFCVKDAIFAAIWVGLAVATRYNSIIVLVALVIFALTCLAADRPHRKAILLLTALLLICGLGFPRCAQAQYELRAETTFGGGVPQICWLVLGLHGGGEDGSPHPAGWFYTNKYTTALHNKNYGDAAATTREARNLLRERLGAFARNPAMAVRFFAEKLTGEWQDPTFESVAYESRYRPATGIADWLPRNQPALWLMNKLKTAIYWFAFVGAIVLFRRKPPALFFVLQLIFLGGVGYHLLFEAKSRYVLHYVVLLLPFAVLGLSVLTTRLETVVAARLRTTPEAFASLPNEEEKDDEIDEIDEKIEKIEKIEKTHEIPT